MAAIRVGGRSFLSWVQDRRTELTIEKLAQFVEKLDGRDLHLLRFITFLAFIVGEVDLLFVIPDVMNELPEQMLHEMQHAYGCDLLGRHLNQIVADLGLLRVQIPTLYEYFLLLSDCILEKFHPRYYVAM